MGVLLAPVVEARLPSEPEDMPAKDAEILAGKGEGQEEDAAVVVAVEEEEEEDDDDDEEVSPRSIRSDLYSPEALTDFAISHTAADEIARRRCPSVISVLASLLERVVARNERLFPPSSAHSSSPPEKRYASFYGIRVPTISIEEYLERIFKYANCSPSCFVVAYAYIDRLVQHQPQLRINSLNVHRVLITSILVSAKFLDDLYYDNAYYAQIGGITTKEMNKLELDFLFLVNFRLQVTVSVFESYCSHLEREVALGGGYQIEKTLKSICALDGETHSNSQRKSGPKALAGS